MHFLYCSQLHNDNILLFTDGMANEGFTESDELIREIQKKKQLVRQECRYPEDYCVKIATLGNPVVFLLQECLDKPTDLSCLLKPTTRHAVDNVYPFDQKRT